MTAAVTPQTHAGYAATWFALSAAGAAMWRVYAISSWCAPVAWGPPSGLGDATSMG